MALTIDVPGLSDTAPTYFVVVSYNSAGAESNPVSNEFKFVPMVTAPVPPAPANLKGKQKVTATIIIPTTSRIGMKDDDTAIIYLR